MANPTNKKKLKEANQQVRLKLKLEKPLIRRMQTFFNKQSRLLNSKLSNDLDFDAAEMTLELKSILSKHYRIVAGKFSSIMVNDINRSLLAYNPNIEPMRNDNKILLTALLLFISNATEKTTDIITNTSNRIVTRATVKAERDIVSGKLKATQKNKAIVKAFNNKKQGRASTIGITETQNAAEGSKHVTAITGKDNIVGNVLTGIGSSGTGIVNWIKRWYHMGDRFVRPWHVEAGGQEQRLEDPYIVGYELLMFPRDDSLGATIKNLARCRCVSIPEIYFL